MPRWIETDTLSNQNISSALAIGAYTADADRLILVQFFADQVAGNGDYIFYITQRLGGAGSSYRHIPITTAAAASGVTAIAGQSGMIAVRSGDVLTVYLDGLAGDTTTPDTSVRWFELDSMALAATQSAITWAQQTISADVMGQGALHVVNANANGTGINATGGSYGAFVEGSTGLYVAGSPGIGMRIDGTTYAVKVNGTTELDGQMRVAANVDSEGALHLVNSNANGIGLMTTGGSAGCGQKNTGRIGTYDLGTVTGAKHEGAVYGTENNASGASGRGVYDVAINTGGEGHVMEGTAYDLTADIHGAVSGAVGSVTGNVTGSVGSIATGGIAAASFAAGAIDAAAIAANAIGASELATDAVAEIADGVWDEAIAGHLTAGTTGAKLNLIGTASYTVTSPVSSDGTAITIVRGDDYLLTDSRQLAFTSTGWPTITGATVKLRVKFGKTATITEYTATVTGAQACYVPLTTVQTAAMVPGVYKFDLQATLSNLSIVTLVQGTLSVWEDVR